MPDHTSLLGAFPPGIVIPGIGTFLYSMYTAYGIHM